MKGNKNMRGGGKGREGHGLPLVIWLFFNPGTLFKLPSFAYTAMNISFNEKTTSFMPFIFLF